MPGEFAQNIKKKCVFVGRFQPFHSGHLEAAKWILARSGILSVAIGSAQEYSTALNPLSCFERKVMIKRALEGVAKKNIEIFYLPDFHNDIQWSKKLAELARVSPKDMAVLTLNPWTERAANKAGIEVVAHPMFFDGLSATEVRKIIAAGADWKMFVPRPVFNHLRENKLDKKIKESQIPPRERIAAFIGETIAKSGMRGAVVAVSGGIDSALVAAMTKKAIGRKAQFVFLPFFKNCPFSKNVALLEKALKIPVKRIYLDRVLDNFARVLPDGGNLAFGNLKPRIRMAVMYYLANQKRLLVVGTTNKTEWEIGYFTKYGDGGVDVEPIADLYKTEVYDLAREMDIPEEIIKTAPTAALWPGQTDEKELGVSYFQLDTVLKMQAVGFGDGDIAALAGIPEEKIEKINARRKKNAHKHSLPPVCMLKR